MTPRHTPAAIAGTEFVQFSPTDQLAVSEAVMAKNMQELQGGGEVTPSQAFAEAVALTA